MTTKSEKSVYKIQGCRVSRPETFKKKIALLAAEDEKIDYYLCFSGKVEQRLGISSPSSVTYHLITIDGLDHSNLIWQGKDRKTKKYINDDLENQHRFVSYLGKNAMFQVRIDVKPQISWFFVEPAALTIHKTYKVLFDGDKRTVCMV